MINVIITKKIFLTWFLSILIVYVELSTQQSQQCPCSDCPCYCDKQNRMNCANSKWTEIPSNFPSVTTTLNFQVNQVTKITARQFDGLDNLELIRLDQNAIKEIESKAFYGLPKLNQLVLSTNQITDLPDDIIDPRAPLANGLKVQKNQISSFPLNLLKRIRTNIQINNNPIDCDCFSVIPEDLKKLVQGQCSMEGKNGKIKKFSISKLTYEDVDCGLCRAVECEFGSCYRGYGNVAKCRCFNGYSGDLCGQKIGSEEDEDEDEEATTIPKDSTKQPLSADVDAVIATPNSTILFQFVSRPLIRSVSKTTGGPLIMEGCTIKVPDRTPQFDPNDPKFKFKTFYIQDDTNKVEISYEKIGEKSYKLENLEIKKSSLTNQGLYKCAVEFEGDLQISKKSAYVQYEDISETRVLLRLRVGQTKRTPAMIEKMVKDYIQSLNLPKEGTLTEVKRGLARRAFYRLKVVYTNLTPAERLDYCIKIRTLDELVKGKTGRFIPMECCGKSIKGKDIETNPKGRGRTVFKPILAGTNVTINCKYERTRTVTRRCVKGKNGPYWEAKSLSNCPIGKKIKYSISEMKSAKLCGEGSTAEDSPLASDEECISIVEKADRLFAAIERNEIESPEDVEGTADIVNDIVGNITVTDNQTGNDDLEQKKKVFNTAISIVDAMLQLDKSQTAKAEMKSGSSTKIVKALESLTTKIGQTLNETNREYSSERKNIAIKVTLLKVADFPNEINVLGISSSSDENAPSINISKQSPLESSVQSKVVIPRSALEGLKDPFISVVNYRDNTFFLSESQLRNISNGKKLTQRVPASNILSASINDQDQQLVTEEQFSNLTEPVTVAFRNTSNSKGTGSIMFWNFTCRGDAGCWMTNGCWSIESNEKDVIAMNCSHLTNFALIIDVNQDGNNPFELQLITYISAGISIVSLLITIIVYLSIRKINRMLAPKMLICLSLSLLILLSLFVAAAERTQPRLGCQIIAATIQYFMLSTFMWTACEGINIYRNFIKLFKTTINENVILIRMSLFAWGIPLVIVFCTVFLAPQELGNSKICVVTGNAFYFGVMAPVCVVLAANWIILFLAIRGMRTQKILLESKEKPEMWREIWRETWRAVMLAVVLGLTWTFGVLAVNYLRDVFQWAFCIFNGLQGFYIFVFFVVRNPDVRKAFRRSFKRETTNYTKQPDDSKSMTLTTQT